MTRRVEWSNDAGDDIVNQVDFILTDNPSAAPKVARRIRETGTALGEYATGHPGRISGTYEKSVPRLPYIIVYALTDQDRAVSILRVIHAARDWQAEEWPE